LIIEISTFLYNEFFVFFEKSKTELDILYFSEEYESIDWYLVREFQYENNCFASDELLSSQSFGFSDIEGKFLDYSSNFKQCYYKVNLHQK
jgi:hypothetical protein